MTALSWVIAIGLPLTIAATIVGLINAAVWLTRRGCECPLCGGAK